MQVSICIFWHIIVECDVNTLNVHAPAEEVSCHQDTFLETLEGLVAREPFLLWHSSVNRNRREVLINQ